MPFSYLVILASLALTSLANGESLAPGKLPTDVLEQKIIGDLTQMIHEYDFSSVFNEAVTEE